jgi:hypothetical protein
MPSRQPAGRRRYNRLPAACEVVRFPKRSFDGRGLPSLHLTLRELVKFDQHVAVFNLQGINSHFRAGIMRGLSRLGIPLPSVPRANQLRTFNRSLP